MAHFAAKRYEQTTDWANKALRQEPDKYTSNDVHLLLATSQAHLGNSEEAKQALAEGMREWPSLKAEFVPLPVYTDPGLRERYLDGLRRVGFDR